MAERFSAIAAPERATLLALRDRIFATAAADVAIGTLVETLKWGQPSYQTVRPKSGTPIRLGVGKSGDPALFVHCQTTLISDFRALHEGDFICDGTRALFVKDATAALDPRLGHLIHRALRYHLG